MKNVRIAALLVLAAVALMISARPSLAAPESHRTINAASPGQQVQIEKFIVKGKTNIFDFYSKFCPPCMRIGPLLEKLAEKNPNVVVNKVDINRPDVQGIDWQSPVAREYNLQSIPHFVIYDASGKKVAEGKAATQQVIDMLKKASLI